MIYRCEGTQCREAETTVLMLRRFFGWFMSCDNQSLTTCELFFLNHKIKFF